MSKKFDLVFKPVVTRRDQLPHGGPKIVVGGGAKKAPQLKDLVERAVKTAREGKVKIRKPRGKAKASGDVIIAGMRWGQDSDSGLYMARRPRVVPVTQHSADYNAVLDGAQSIADRLKAARFASVDHELFSGIQREAEWAVTGMPGYGDAFKDNLQTVTEFRHDFNDGLSPILDVLIPQEPDVPVSELVKAAAQHLLETAGDLYGVIAGTSAVIEGYHYEDNLPVLKALNTIMTNLFHLAQGYDLEKVCAGVKTDPILPLSWFNYGDKILTALMGDGLGVVPGGKIGKGALGLHLLFFQRDMLQWIAEALGYLPHENQHLIANDRAPFLKEFAQVLFGRVHDEIETGKVDIEEKTIEICGEAVPAADGLAKLSVDLMQEDDADGGAIRAIGGEYFYPVAWGFPALSSRTGRIGDSPFLLRRGSVFFLRKLRDGRIMPVFEPHSPDAVRILKLAYHLKALGRNEEAEEKMKLARELTGKVDAITWKPASDKWGVDPVVISYKDLEAIMPIIADVSMNHKFQSLGGRSQAEVVNYYNAHGGTDPMRRDKKASDAADILYAGQSDLPKGVQNFFPMLVIPAAIKAYWKAALKGEAATFGPKLQPNVLAMIEKAAAACVGCR